MNSIQQQQEDDLMELLETDDELLVELLDASDAGADEPEEAAAQQLGFTFDVDGDGWGEVDGQELNSIYPHQDCEDCGLDRIMSDFEFGDHGCSRSPAPYVVFDDDLVEALEWTDTAEAAMGPFTGERMGEWYMDGMIMEWNDDGGSGFSFEPCYGGEAGTEQVYGSPLWE
ncbi:uncharacterized protein LOC133910094 [Phragmites australis]|uniref:uncharacterized protein LOC133910094 n=1 Tax=Phragmites australis TaxID=29695 RepID=UPI002D7938DF|nr:uncharacterized protein LOC133910094 [Phragmites australis]